MPRDRLPCGAPYDDLVAQVSDGVRPADAEHERTCPHCRATLAELRDLWAPVTRLVDEDVHAPADVLAAVMARVRELPRHVWHAVIPTDRGSTRIAARVVTAVVRLAARDVPGVSLAVGAGGSRLSDDAADVGVAGRRVVVDIQVAVAMGAEIPDVADRLRRRIARDVADQLELDVEEINVTIADVR